ncbi:hypothetical protein [Candidatus Liberibacter americanus]|uniref:Uncharacterized protein n=1 Tax=Candidatus Liberibacter americanus str. Sao Paulo TaxID=1261131 RepID=U6B7Q7_9HYPH|nr:hypothetical protein [Candidatus Liberibacter americanus]AHA27896.1 hypothetical protein lam_544 [Candidatus Liberibacter americanus str. Sao Paulo]
MIPFATAYVTKDYGLILFISCILLAFISAIRYYCTAILGDNMVSLIEKDFIKN